MPLVVRYIEPRRERHPSTKTPLPGRPIELEAAQSQREQDLPEEYKEVDKLLTLSSSVPILESVSMNPLQALVVHRIGSSIRELSSLAQHAEGIMGAIADSLADCHARSTRLEERARRLQEEVLASLDPELEATEGFEIPHPDFQFKSHREGGQLMLSRHPPSPPLAAVIQAAHTPPLNLLSNFWPDGRNALIMYSNPSYFFEQWMSSVKKGALLRRKSSGHVLSPTGTKPNGARFDTAGRVSPIGGVKKLKRSATMVSRSTRRKARPLSYHSSSNLSLDRAGLAHSAKPKNLQRTYSVRASPGYRSTPKKDFKIPKSKHLADPLAKTIAALFAQIEVTVAETSDLEKPSGRSPTKSDSASKLQRGGIRRSFSLRRSRSRSKSPLPPSAKATPESTASGQRLEESTKSSSSDVTVLPKKPQEQVGNSAPKATSTFKSASGILNRSNVPLLTRISTPTTLRPRTTSDAGNPQSVSPIQRSKTVAGPNNANLKNVAARVRDKINSQRPVSMIGLPLPGRESPLLGKASSQSSLRTSSSQSTSNSRPHSMLLTVDGDIHPLTQELTPKVSGNSQSRKPRRPAPPRPPSAESGGRGTPDSAKMGRTTPNAGPTPTSSSNPEGDSNISTQITTLLKTDPSRETKLEDSVEKSDTGSVKRSPPPPPQRNHGLSNAANPQTATAQGPSAGSGPATPGTAHAAVITQSSLDAERRQSVAFVLSEVLTNMSRRSNPVSPTSPLPLNGDLNRTITPGKSVILDRVLSPVTPLGGSRAINLDTTLTPFEHSPKFAMSPVNSFSTPNRTPLPTGTFGKSPRIPPSKRRFSKRAGSLYISPHKLTSTQENGGLSERSDDILKAGGVPNGRLEDASRNDLLVAIRKGLRLKKVEEEAARSNTEVAWDVAAILERYDVLHSDSDEDSEEVDDEWMDEFDN